MQETHLKGLHVSTLFIVGFYLFSKKKCCIGGPAIAIVAPQLQEPFLVDNKSWPLFGEEFPQGANKNEK